MMNTVKTSIFFQNDLSPLEGAEVIVGTIQFSEVNMAIQIKYQPKGFWSDVVNVWIEYTSHSKILEIRIDNSSGGRNGTLTSIESAQSLIECLEHAVNVCKVFESSFKKAVEDGVQPIDFFAAAKESLIDLLSCQK